MFFKDLQRLYYEVEDLSDAVSRRTRRILPMMARLCLTATFIEDALRMWFFWNQHHIYFERHLKCWSSVVTVIMYANLVGQLVGSTLVLLRYFITLAVALLMGIVMLHLQIYAAPWRLELLLHNFSLLGGLLLLYVETRQLQQEVGCMDAGLPLLVNTQRQKYMQLTGRILVVFMYLTLFHFQSHLWWSMLLNVLGLLLLIMVVLGYRTRQAALTLANTLFLWNVYKNAWWFAEGSQREILKYNYFHTLSVIGGLLMVVSLGPGQVSLEQYKKRW